MRPDRAFIIKLIPKHLSVSDHLGTDLLLPYRSSPLTCILASPLDSLRRTHSCVSLLSSLSIYHITNILSSPTSSRYFHGTLLNSKTPLQTHCSFACVIILWYFESYCLLSYLAEETYLYSFLSKFVPAQRRWRLNIGRKMSGTPKSTTKRSCISAGTSYPYDTQLCQIQHFHLLTFGAGTRIFSPYRAVNSPRWFFTHYIVDFITNHTDLLHIDSASLSSDTIDSAQSELRYLRLCHLISPQLLNPIYRNFIHKVYIILILEYFRSPHLGPWSDMSTGPTRSLSFILIFVIHILNLPDSTFQLWPSSYYVDTVHIHVCPSS